MVTRLSIGKEGVNIFYKSPYYAYSVPYIVSHAYNPYLFLHSLFCRAEGLFQHAAIKLLLQKK